MSGSVNILDNFVKTYDLPYTAKLPPVYRYTAMVRHAGTVIALAIDSHQLIWYTVLDLDDAGVKSPLDVHYWLKDPQLLLFPRELAHVGYGVVPNTPMPDPAPDKREEDKTAFEKYFATSGRLTADAPFQALSDGQYVYVFRQAITGGHQRMVEVEAGGKPRPIVDGTLLVDRFVFAGGALRPRIEIRYQRSRQKHRPASRKDSLSAKDMEGRPFYEPTQELRMVRPLALPPGQPGSSPDPVGRFAVLLLPTSIPNVRRWQIFSYNARTRRVDSFNVERSEDGLFNTRGTHFYTCADHPEVFETSAEEPCGQPSLGDPKTNCGKQLVPTGSSKGYAETALSLAEKDEVKLPAGAFPAAAAERTVEVWARRSGAAAAEAELLHCGGAGDHESFALCTLAAKDRWRVQLSAGGKDNLEVTLAGSGAGWHHYALTYDGREVKLYYDGVEQAAKAAALNTAAGDCRVGRGFAGDVDEVRAWAYARRPADLAEHRCHRLIGNEDGLAGYWRFDEGTGAAVRDQTDGGHDGTHSGDPAGAWVASDAPVGDNPGVRRGSFEIKGRAVASGMSAILYYQQEKAATGYGRQEKPLKRAARVMLAAATRDPGTKKDEVTVLDFGVSRAGRLALVPDVLDLQTLSYQKAAGGISYKDALDQIEALQKEIFSKRTERGKLEERLSALDRSDPSLGVPPDGEFMSLCDRYITNLRHWAIQAMSRGNMVYLFIDYGSCECRGESIGPIKGYFGKTGTWNKIDAIAKSRKEVRRLREAEINGHQARITELKAEVKKKDQEKQKLEDDVRGEITIPMPLVHRDRFGFTVSGGILGFARTVHSAQAVKDRWNVTPLLVDSATGKLGLYFAGGDHGRLLACYFDTETEKARYRLLAKPVPPSKQGPTAAVLVAQSDDAAMDQAAIKVAGGDACTLTLEAGGRKETWPGLPRDPELLARILNGNASPRPAHLKQTGSVLRFSDQTTVDLGDRLALAGPHTIEFWIKCTKRADGDWQILVRGTGNDHAPGIWLRELSAGIHWRWGTGGTKQVGITGEGSELKIGRWYHLAGVRDGDKLTVYVDGDDPAVTAPLATVTATVPNQDFAKGPLRLGRTRSHSFAGQLAELRIWGKALSRAEIAANLHLRLHHKVPGLLACWPLDDGGGAEARDATGGGHTGKITRPIWLPSALALGTSDPAHYDYARVQVEPGDLDVSQGSTLFRAVAAPNGEDVADQAVQSAAATRSGRWLSDSQGHALELGKDSDDLVGRTQGLERSAADGDLTLEAWVKPRLPPAEHSLVVHHHSDDSRYLLGLTKEKDQLRVTANVRDASRETEALFPCDRWTHLAAVYKQSWGLHFDGRDDYLDAGSAEVLNIDGELTVELFVQVEKLSGEQGLLTKGRLQSHSDQHVPYALSLAGDGHLVFRFETKDGKLEEVKSTGRKLETGQFYRVAMTREQGQDEIKSTDKAKDLKGRVIQDKDGNPLLIEKLAGVKEWQKVSLWLKGGGDSSYLRIAEKRFEGRDTGTSNQPLEIAKAYTGDSEARFFHGILSEVRVWSTARDPGTELGAQIEGREQGLAAWWTFEENHGHAAGDRRGGNHAAVSGATWLRNPDPEASTLEIYVNGVYQTCRDPAMAPAYGQEMLSLGGCANDQKQLMHRLVGQLEETRIWSVRRTQEQIQDNMHRRLLLGPSADDPTVGERRHLLAYYKFDAQSVHRPPAEQLDLKYKPPQVEKPPAVDRIAKVWNKGWNTGWNR